MRVKVTAAVISKDSKILVAQKGGTGPLAGKWEFPGGKIEDGETPEMCLKRELEEELGISIEVNEFICSSSYDYEHISIELLAFSCRWLSGDLKQNEHLAFRWCNPEELLELDLMPADKPIVEHLQNRR